MSLPPWHGARRLVVVEPTAGLDELLDDASGHGIETVVVPGDEGALRRLVETLGDGRDAVLATTPDGVHVREVRVAARRTGAWLWEVGPGTGEVVATDPDTLPDDTLDDLHADQGDPWGAETRWYERRKRALVLAALPRERFADGLELGCSTGVLAAELASRCDRLLAVDGSPTALAAARRRLDPVPGVRVARLDVPHEWPTNRVLDLVVVSEVGYFLSPAALDRLVARIAGCLATDGVVVLCHWRHPVEGWVMDAEEVHRRFEGGGLPPVQATYRDRDVELRVLAADAQWPDPAR